MKNKVIRIALFGIICVLSIVFLSNILIIGSTERYVFEDFEEIPHNKVGVVMGISNKLVSGDTNQYFYERIKVTAHLFKKKKIDKILVSGYNRSRYYNEPQMMKEALINEGIPESDIYTDDKGLRTWDSILRGKMIFGQASFTIITQPFHSYRAIFIARNLGIDAVAMVSSDISIRGGLKTKFREIFARTVAIWDLFIANRDTETINADVIE